MPDVLSNRLAAMNIPYSRHSLPHFLNEAAALGFSKIERWTGMPYLSLEGATHEDIRFTEQLLRERELGLICLTPEQCLYPINLASEHRGTARRSPAYFLRAMEVAEARACPQMLVTAGCGYANQPAAVAWDRARDHLGDLAQEAQKKGVILLLELLSKTAGETPEEYHNRFGDRLHHVHVCDSTPEGHLAWGDGTPPLAEYVHTLEKSGYTGSYSFEFVATDYWLDPRTPLAHSRSNLLQSL